MQSTSTYKYKEKITRFTITTPLISHKNSADQHEVFVTLGNGRTFTVPKNGSYRVHLSGVLEVNLEATTTYYPKGEWLKIKDTNLTKYLQYLQEATQDATLRNI